MARAARAGGKTAKRERPKLAFPLAVFVIVVLGSLLVVYARSTKTDTAAADVAPSSAKADHWHAAYGIYVCDHYLPPLTDAKDDKLGIHTHGEGIMHVHPFVAAASGDNARLKVFADQVGMTLYNDGFKLPDGTEFRDGSAKCGDQPAKVEIFRWKADDPSAPVEVFDSGFGDIRYREDRDVYAIAVIPQDQMTAPPLPDSVAQLDKLTDVDQGAGGTTPDPSVPAGITIPPSGSAGAPPVTDASSGAATASTTPASPVSSTPASTGP